MKTTTYNVIRFNADEDKVFDWAHPEKHMVEDPETHEMTVEHLYATTLFIGENDSIDNYVEIEAPVK